MSTAYGFIIEFSRNEKLQKQRIMYKPRTGRPTWIGILWKWASKPTELAGAGDDECRLTRFHPIINVLAKWNLSFFKDVPSNRLTFYLGSLLHIISSLFNHFYLFQNAILHKHLKLGFWNFKPIFLRTQFSLLAIFFFYLVLLISFSWHFSSYS